MIEFQLKYKGSRNYLHGSDFYLAIDQQLGAALGGHTGRLAFKSFARHQCQLHLQPPKQGANVMGGGVWRTPDGQDHRFWLVETQEPVTESYPFDEDSIVRPATMEGEIIVGTNKNPYSVIENVIALTKRINYALSPDIDGKWLFGQLDLSSSFPDRWSIIQIDHLMCLANRFSRNRIVIDGVTVGEIRFIVGEP